MLLTGESIKGLSELSTLKDLHKQVMSQIDKQNEALKSIAETLKKTVESIDSSDSKVTDVLTKVSSQLSKGISIKEMPESKDKGDKEEYEYLDKLSSSIEQLSKYIESNNKMMNQISSFDKNISSAISKLDMKDIKAELQKLNKNVENKNDKWEFEIVRNVGGYMTSVVAKKS